MNDFSIKSYFERLFTQFGHGWNRFWYTPSDPLPLSLIRVATGLLALYFILTYTADVSHFFSEKHVLGKNVFFQKHVFAKNVFF